MADSVYPTISLMPPGNAAVIPPNVEYRLPESTAMLEKWDMLSDCIAGQDAIKKKTTKYLPMPNAEDQSTANRLRYEGYVARAMFFNVVGNTVSGLVGQVFNSDPVSEYPDELEPLWYDADGRGVTLVQSAKKALVTTLAKGFCGILVDFPEGLVDDAGNAVPFTRQDVNDGLARPTIQFYGPVDIINWRFKLYGAVSKLTLLVLKEDYIIRDDGFEIQRGKEYRVLRLVNDQYVVEQWRRTDEKQEGPFVLFKTSVPTDAAGLPLKSIPFFFIGAQNNDSQIDKPPMYDLACINIAHYRNSADYEDSVYMVGQPTPYFAGLTQSWVENVLKEKVQLGSRGAIPLPAGGTAGLVQAAPNTMVKEAMDTKQHQMVSLGAQLVEDKQVQRTLGEAKMETTIVVSTLSSCARNVSQAYENALIAASQFAIGEVNKDEIIFKLSTDFAIAKMSPEDRKALLAEWQGGLLSFTEAREQLRQSGIATLDDKDAQEEIAKDQEAAIDLAKQEFEATGALNPADPADPKQDLPKDK